MGPGPELGPLLSWITDPRASAPDLLWMGHDVLASPNIPAIPQNSLSIRLSCELLRQSPRPLALT